MKHLQNIILDLDPMVNCTIAQTFHDLQFDLPCLKSLQIYGETVLPGPLFLEPVLALLQGCHSTITEVVVLVPELNDFILKFQTVLQTASSLRKIFVNFNIPKSAPRNWPHLEEITVVTKEVGFKVFVPGTASFKERFDS